MLRVSFNETFPSFYTINLNFAGDVDEYVFTKHGGWAHHEKTGQEVQEGKQILLYFNTIILT